MAEQRGRGSFMSGSPLVRDVPLPGREDRPCRVHKSSGGALAGDRECGPQPLSPERFHTTSFFDRTVISRLQCRSNFSRRNQVHLTWIGSDQKCPGSRCFKIPKLLCKSDRNIRKARTAATRSIGERDHQGSFRASHQIGTGAGWTHSTVHANPVVDPRWSKNARQRNACRGCVGDRDLVRL